MTRASVIPGRASKSAVADLDIDNDPTRVNPSLVARAPE
jgi:hypothetical protein